MNHIYSLVKRWRGFWSASTKNGSTIETLAATAASLSFWVTGTADATKSIILQKTLFLLKTKKTKTKYIYFLYLCVYIYKGTKKRGKIRYSFKASSSFLCLSPRRGERVITAKKKKRLWALCRAWKKEDKIWDETLFLISILDLISRGEDFGIISISW